MPLEVIVCVLGNRNTLGVLYISYSVVNDINNPLISHCFLFIMALKGIESAPNPQR